MTDKETPERKDVSVPITAPAPIDFNSSFQINGTL